MFKLCLNLSFRRLHHEIYCQSEKGFDHFLHEKLAFQFFLVSFLLVSPPLLFNYNPLN